MVNGISEIYFSNYKCFNATPGHIAIDMKSNISLIIGRNNSGKSSLIDVIEKAIDPKVNLDVKNLFYSIELTEDIIGKEFNVLSNGGVINGNHFEYGSRFIGQHIGINSNGDLIDNVCSQGLSHSLKICRSKWRDLAKNCKISNPICRLYRINADRDIVPEVAIDSYSVDKTGIGATNVIRRFINEEKLDEKIVEKKILTELNRIVMPDAYFSGIRIQQIHNRESSEWEIFLEEGDNRYALSKSGSGLKTILLILINLYALPEISENSGKKSVYAFEEVENNLHPALQRRLFDYLYEYAVNNNKRIFLTTHSHVAINAFYGKPGVSLYHVTKNDEGTSVVQKIDNNQMKLNILDDLDVKASDIFQANGIIWVEGPSDRIYIKKWLEVFGKNDISEGKDYQFAYYGGKILSHLTSVEDNNKTNDLLNILKTNRHAAIVIDSDKRKKNAHINESKRRIRDEFKTIGCFCWITLGKEIENYITKEAVNAVHQTNKKQIGQYEVFPDYIRNVDKNFSCHKVESARNYTKYITLENSAEILDLKDKIEQLYAEIKKW